MIRLFGGLVIAGALCSVSALANVAYTNGPASGNVTGWTINFGFSVADTFTLLSNQTLTDVKFGAQLESGDTATSVDWAIVLDPTNIGGTTLFSGTSALSQTFLSSPTVDSLDLDTETFNLPGNVTIGPGIFWLVLQNLVTTSGDPGYWDENDGPSQAWESSVGFLTAANAPGSCSVGAPGFCSEAFTIDNTLPEPSSMMLGGTGLLLLAGALRRRKKR